MRDYRFSQHGFQLRYLVQHTLRLSIDTTAKITHTVSKIGIDIRGLPGNIGKTLLAD